MRTLALAVVGASFLVGAAHADPPDRTVPARDRNQIIPDDPVGPPLSTERTVDAASGLTMSEPAADGGDFRPGLALAVRGYTANHLYLAGSIGASLATEQASETAIGATVLSLGAGAGLYGEQGGWTGYAGARAEWVKSLDWPQGSASRDPDWFTSGVGAGPSLAIARRIGFAWGHPMAIELAASYMMYSLRRPEVYVIQIVPPVDAPPAVDLDGLQVGLFLAGTLFPDRPR